MRKDDNALSFSKTPFIERLLPAPVNGGFKMNDYWVWGGSVAKDEDGLFHMFVSRWSKRLPMFEGYMFSSEIVRAVSPTPEGPYEFVERILPSEIDSKKWDGRMAHNPTIRKCGDLYLLYYIASTFDGPVPSREDLSPSFISETYNKIRIGLAVSESLSGPWKTFDEPILDIRPNCWDNTVVTNPAPCILGDGRIFLYYRSRGIGLAGAEHWSGPYKRDISQTPVIQTADKNDKKVEDPYIWWNGKYLEMLAKDITGKITGEIKAGAHLYSFDGLQWLPHQNPKGYSRAIFWDDGTSTEQGCLERPFLLFDDNGNATHLFAATGDGPGDFRNAENTWNMVIPLKKSEDKDG